VSRKAGFPSKKPRRSNAAAGRWNEGRLPLRSAKLALAAQPDHAADITLSSLLAELGNTQAAAGTVQGQGEWRNGRWTLATTVQALQPAQLDARAPAMQLAGTLGLSGGDVTTPATPESQVLLMIAIW